MGVKRKYANYEKGKTMPERKRCCCNCGNNIRTESIIIPGLIQCHCAIDNHWISYGMSLSDWCHRWKKDRKWDGERE